MASASATFLMRLVQRRPTFGLKSRKQTRGISARGVVCFAPLLITTFAFADPAKLRAEQFLPPEYLSSPFHKVEAHVQNDGIANRYVIRSPHGTHIVTGTEYAKVRIREIEATEYLRKKTALDAVGKMAERRALNLVKTPIRVASAVGDRLKTVDSFEDAVFFVPENVGYLIGRLGDGIDEVGVTGARLVRGGKGGPNCTGVSCVTKAGSDAVSGFNSVVGKHRAARRIHRTLGTHPQSVNRALQNEVDRLARIEAYSGVAVSIGLGGADVYGTLAPFARGVGYVNDGEFLMGYEDARRRANADKARLHQWAIPPSVIRDFYKNDSYSDRMRAEMVSILGGFSDVNARRQILLRAKSAETRYTAQQNLVTLRFFKSAINSGQIKTLLPESQNTVGVTQDGTLVLPYVADYLQLTPRSRKTIAYLHNLKRLHPQYQTADIHVIGEASPDFIAATKRAGLRITRGR